MDWKTSYNYGRSSPTTANGQDDSDAQVISIEALKRSGGVLTKHSLPAVPEDLLSRIARIHSDPKLWWYSQLVKYVVRPNSNLRKHLEIEKKKLFGEFGGIQNYIGVHIRKGDKVSTGEGQGFSVANYVKRVEDYAELQATEKIAVYLASDDIQSLVQLRSDYGNNSMLDIAGSNMVSPRTGCGSGFLAIITDVYMLAESNYIVCTISSNVCRLAFELMQTLHIDRGSSVNSLDLAWKPVRSGDFEMKAIVDHVSQADHEISFNKEDLIVFQFTRKPITGYSFGTHQKTGKVGYYPSYKAEPTLTTEKFPL